MRIIGHDLRNSFFVTKGLADILSITCLKCDNEKNKKHISMLSNSVKSNYNILESLLLWSKMNDENFNYKPHQFILSLIIDEVTKNISTYAQYKNIKTIHNRNDNFKVLVDKNMIKTVIRNLLYNSMKYTEKDGEIIISYEKYNDEFIIVSISDTGKGMPKKIANKLFSDNSVSFSKGTSGEKGTGLGLMICEDLVNMYKGKIWAESKLNTGSTFYFTIPIAI